MLVCVAHFCVVLGRFRGPVCPEWLQEQLLTWMIESAERGRPGFKEMLTMTPCHLFPLLRGRTLWLMGDSMMQVRLIWQISLPVSKGHIKKNFFIFPLQSAREQQGNPNRS